MCRLITSSRPPLPGKPEGFSRSDTKRLPARGLNLNRSCLQAVSFLPPPQGDGSLEGHFMELQQFSSRKTAKRSQFVCTYPPILTSNLLLRTLSILSPAPTS